MQIDSAENNNRCERSQEAAGPNHPIQIFSPTDMTPFPLKP